MLGLIGLGKGSAEERHVLTSSRHPTAKNPRKSSRRCWDGAPMLQKHREVPVATTSLVGTNAVTQGSISQSKPLRSIAFETKEGMTTVMVHSGVTHCIACHATSSFYFGSVSRFVNPAPADREWPYACARDPCASSLHLPHRLICLSFFPLTYLSSSQVFHCLCTVCSYCFSPSLYSIWRCPSSSKKKYGLGSV